MSAPRPYAVVTGASSGLGAAFARELAARGYDLFVVARRKDRLDALAAELRGAGAATTVAQADLGVAEAVAALVARIRSDGRPVDLLVNNAGFGRYATTTALDGATLQTLVAVNVVAPAILARELGADMHAGAGGAIVNVASTASFQPVPHFSAYAATKAFLLSLSESMHVELRPKVRVLAVCPGFTKTEFHEAAGGLASHLLRFPAMDPRRVVLAALRGLERGRAVVVPGFMNKAQVFLSKIAPRALVRYCAGKLFEPRG